MGPTSSRGYDQIHAAILTGGDVCIKDVILHRTFCMSTLCIPLQHASLEASLRKVHTCAPHAVQGWCTWSTGMKRGSGGETWGWETSAIAGKSLEIPCGSYLPARTRVLQPRMCQDILTCLACAGWLYRLSATCTTDLYPKISSVPVNLVTDCSRCLLKTYGN